MPLSMTGFGAAEGEMAGRRAQVEVRTVNHRWFNLAVRLPTELASAEADLREALRRRFDRGHIAVHVRWVNDPHPASPVDVARLEMAAASVRSLQQRLQLDGPVTLDVVLRHAALMADEVSVERIGWDAVAPVVEQAVDTCLAMRRQEGAALADELLIRLRAFERVVGAIADCAPERLVRERDRLTANIRELIDDGAVDEGRLATELAVAADRLDITEELVRLRAHIEAARAAIAGDSPAGKALGFLAQEMGREVNTIGSKANDLTIAHAVVQLKGELEKLREQADNLE